MTPGTILFDNQFEYEDGTTGEKLLVVLNDGEIGYYIIIKTTSRPDHKGITYGCQNTDRYPNFYLPKSSCCLKKHTWVLLDKFFEFSASELIAWHFDGRINRIGVLPDGRIKELLECAINCDDISGNQASELRRTLRNLTKK